ncbi:AAA family ATPase [Conexibacter sp. W3-3-2]|uniref:ATP-binding protein n=1 Tax=Conexibacter sp. W3-3-2 TaxID=2675227 RepID=UPI0012B8AFA1|nr:helix-turn-helix transcriptional regulator [Conexibacter sp. W3-3-2]MTD44915.1 AAA family ATPase [Conexibacter sp. W3-3-2]
MGRPSAAIVERGRELAAIDVALADVAAGTGALVVLEGPGGIGKTLLAEECAQRARRLELPTLMARSVEGEREIPHGLVARLLGPRLAGADDDERAMLLAGPAARAAPIFDPGAAARTDAPADPEFAIQHGLAWLVANLAEDTGLVLVCDDAHRADAPSLRALRYLARRIEDLGVLLLVATRRNEPGSEHALLDDLSRVPRAVVLRPRELTADAVGALVARAGVAADAAVVDAIHVSSGGVPFYVNELLRAVAAAPDEATADALRAHGDVRRTVVARRFTDLAPAAALLARIVVVAGAHAVPSRVAEVAGLPLEQVLTALDALVATEFLTVADDGTIGFVHPLVEAAVDAEIGPDERRDRHAQLAALLHAEQAHPEHVAAHLLESLPDDRPWAIDTLREAARAASARGAPEIAARLLERALREPPSAEARGAVLEELGVAQLRAGDARAAATLALALAERRTIGAARALVRALAAGGGSREVFDMLAPVADAHRDDDPEGAMLLDADIAALGLLEPASADAISQRLDRYRDVRGATAAERLVLVALAQQSWVSGNDVARTAELARSALGDGLLLARETSDSVAVGQAIFALVVADGLVEAEQHLDAVVADAEGRGSIYGYTSAATIRALARLRAGDVAGAEVAARASLDAADHAVLTPSARAFLAIALAERDDLVAAAAVVAPRPGLPAVLPPTMPSIHVAYARGLVALLTDRIDEARAALLDAGARETSFAIRAPVLAWRLLLAGVMARSGDVTRARSLVDEHAALARRWGSTTVLAGVERIQAMFVAEPERQRELDAVVQRARRGVDRLELARALVDGGIERRRAGDAAAARERLGEALGIADAMGARALGGRARRELEKAGGRPARTRSSGVEALTDAEQRIVPLVALGRTNREIAQALFLTPKTVENHLGRMYRKLGIGSRAELAALVGTTPD